MADAFPSLDHAPRAFPLPTISEDTLHYVLHLPSSYEPAATALLITQHVQILLLRPWLWHKDDWELKVVHPEPESASRAKRAEGLGGKLEGTMRVGDAVDDEWLVVWLLREVSRKWGDITISVKDTDGQFLLIEAATELPSWVSPDNADNRLWLQGGHLHLIPLSIRSSASQRPKQTADDDDFGRQTFDPETYLSERDATIALHTDAGSGRYRASASLERAVWSRIACYPAALNTHQHRTKAYLPVAVAKVLSTHPELVQRAAEGFYVRDPSQLRAAARMTHFPPSPSILAPVTLTRAAYAQLQGQVFHPPRVFGPEWHVREGSELDNERRWRDLGLKIATGFEIMYREGGKKGRGGTDEEHEGVRDDEDCKAFLLSLKKAGWFGTEMEGSSKWQEREKEAVKGYQAVKAADTASQRPSFAYLADTALETTSKVAAETLAVDPSAPEDSESWLEVSPDELDAMMMRASGQAPGQNAEDAQTTENANIGGEDGQALQDLAKKVEEFVGGEGDLMGARFADELSDEDMDDSDDEDEEDEAEQRKSLEAEKQTRLQKLVPSLPDEEWGKKTQSTNVSTPIDEEASTTTESRTKPKPVSKKDKQVDPIDALKAKSRPPIFAKQEFDGVVDESESESESESELPPPGTLGRKIAMMKWGDGAPKDAQIEEIDDEEDRPKGLGMDDDLEEEMQSRVWGGGDDDEADEKAQGDEAEEMDVDMGNEEEEFLKFSRDALGISDEMWEGILGDRRARGAFVPSSRASSSPAKTKINPEGSEIKSENRSNADLPRSNRKKSVSFASQANVRMFEGTEPKAPKTTVPSAPTPSTSNANSSLDSFENIMRAMEEELSRNKAKTGSSSTASSKQRAGPQLTTPGQKGKSQSSSSSSAMNSGPLPPLPTEADLESMDPDDLLAMDRELREALKGAGIEDDDDDMGIEGVGDLDEEGKREYEMMKMFLESYQSQAGGSGVVGNLFGRLGKQ